VILAIQIEIIIELIILALVLLGFIAISSVIVVRNLRITYKDLYRQQSKFDIELRKAFNLLTKAIKIPDFEPFENAVIKDLPYAEKKQLLALIDENYESLDLTKPAFQYLKETYENLQENRRILDAKVLLFNQKISYFPFNLYSKLMKYSKQHYYTHK
jgi:hypothetical protein